MFNLMQAIVTRYKKSTTLMPLTPGGIHQGLTKQAPFDYVTVTAPEGGTSGNANETYGGHHLDAIVVTFSIWSTKSGSAAKATADAIVAAYKDWIPALTAPEQVTNVLLMGPPYPIPQRAKGPKGEQVILVVFSIKYSLQLW